MSIFNKTLAEKLYEQDKRNFISMSEQQINTAINSAFNKWIAEGGPEILQQQFAYDLVAKAAEVTVDAAATLKGAEDLKDKKLRKITQEVLMRACQSGEFDTVQTVKGVTDHLLTALRNRMMQRISAIISEARAEAQVNPKLIAEHNAE